MWFLCRAWFGRVGLALAIGLAVDVDDEAVLSTAVDSGVDRGGAIEDLAPLLVCEVGCDDGRCPWFVPLGDDVEEVVCAPRAVRDVAELVKDQEVRLGVPLHAALHGEEAVLLADVGQHGGDRREADVPPPLQRKEAEVLGDGRLAEAGGAAEQDVVAVVDKGEREQLVDEVLVDAGGPFPVEGVDGSHGPKSCTACSTVEISAGSFPGLGCDEELADLGWRRLSLVHVVEERAEHLLAGTRSRVGLSCWLMRPSLRHEHHHLQ